MVAFEGCDLSARRAGEDLHELGDLAALLAGVAAGDGALDAMADMVAQHLVLDPLQGGARRGDLGQDVDAVAILLDHAGDAAHLSFDSIEPPQAGVPCIGLHPCHVPSRGIYVKPAYTPVRYRSK